MPPGGVVEVKFTFKEGGAFDFHTHYERVRERLQQAVENLRMEGDASSSSRTGMNGVDVSNVNLEDLPAYQEEGDGPLIPPIAASALQARRSPPGRGRDSGLGEDEDDNGQSRSKPSNDTPSEPPPGYEEAQMDALESRLNDERR